MRGLALSALVLGAAATSPVAPSEDRKIQHLDAAGEFTYLGDLQPTHQSVGWGSYWVNRNWYVNGFVIAGQHYDNGVFAHAPSDVRYHIGGKYAFFSGCVGLDDGNVADAGDGATCGDGVDFRVIVDGEEKFKHHASGGEAAKCFRVSVKGAINLKLVADHRTDMNCDESAWVNTKLYEDPVIDCYQLGDLNPSFKSIGYESYFVNENWYKEGFMIKSQRYNNGVFAHANSKLVYPLHGKYHTFHGCAGVDDTNSGCGEGAHFAVRSDGRKRWERQITHGDSAQCFSMSVADAFALELRTSKSDTNNACDRAEWVNADLCITAETKTKVDCVVENWTDSSWSKCSKDCNTGYMSRSRQITTHPEHGGKHCPPIHEVKTCNTQPCPIDCVEDSWSTATPCTVTCTAAYVNDGVTDDKPAGSVVSGYQSRFRSIKVAPAYGGKACAPLTEKVACNTQRCPIDCKTSEYSGDGTPITWSACSKSCNGGTRTRTLRVIQQPAFNGKTCDDINLSEPCNEQDCQVDATCGAWTAWTVCTKECNTGYKQRTRAQLTAAAHGGKTCGTTEQVVECNTKSCPIDCVLETHADWDDVLHPCSRSCGGGTKTRATSVKTPAAYGGKPCGSLTQTVPCKETLCPVDCQYSLWGSWSQWDKSCTGSDGVFAKRTRRRSVIKTYQHGGKTCPHLSEEQLGNKHSCPVDCEMTDFGSWSTCSLSCGGGTQTRSKTVLRQGDYGGIECPASTEQEQGCNEGPCPIDCTLHEWGSYMSDGVADACSRDCGGGWQTRTREVNQQARYGGERCGPIHEQKACNTQECPIPCKYTNWSHESIELATCDRSCGGGRRTRTRSITQKADFGATPCGSIQDIGSCNLQPCPQDCVVSEWSVWTDCSKSCGFGHQQRSRSEIRGGHNGGKTCTASALFEERQCNAGPCSAACEVSAFSAWTTCKKNGVPVSCGTGVQKRTRSITKQPDVRVDQSEHDITPCPFLEETRACSQVPCEQDCILNPWFDWSPCTMTCGTGWKRRHATIKQHNVGGGKNCPALVEVQACNTEPCPVHCAMTPFSVWSECSDACGGGEQERTRAVMRKGDYGGAECGRTSETRSCNTQSCPQDCVVDQSWTEGTCSADCGGGVRHDTKSINTPAAYGGAACPATSRTEACNQQHCPLDCKLTAWSTWSTCTKTCGGAGTQTKTRMIDVHPRFNGQACEGVIDTQECNMGPCPVHCSVSEWTEWTPCSKTCGTGATRSRERTVTQFSDFGGYQCPALSEVEACAVGRTTITQGEWPGDTHDHTGSGYVGACPEDCEVEQWTSWTTCDRSCGGGVQSRSRARIRNSNGQFNPQNGGKNCPQRNEERKCNGNNCPIDCGYTAFGWNGVDGAWSTCSKPCGGGTRQQRRQITSAMAYGGRPCPARTKIERCPGSGPDGFQLPCPVDCQMGSWSWWSPCSKSCGGGVRTRSREIHRLKVGAGKQCLPTTQEEPCNDEDTVPCPIDCEMDTWGSWGRCSAQCGLGTQTRSRGIKNDGAESGGKPCLNTKETKNCKLMDCPVDCEVNPWGGWHKCNRGCGGGIQHRYRQVTVAPANGGKQCQPLSEQKSCKTQACPVHCTVTDFNAWSKCSRSCGTGIMIRKRDVHQEAQLGGNQCPDLAEARSCNVKPCPVDCEVSAFTAYSACSKSCGMGFKFRTRSPVRAAAHGGAKCAALTETVFCNVMECPIACVLGEWSGWNACSKTCGHGTRVRTRRIIRDAEHGGAKCMDILRTDKGVEQQATRLRHTEPCFKETCPINCKMGTWGGWNACSTDCGPGVETNTRVIERSAGPKGKACPIPAGSTVSTMKTQPCNLGVCAKDCIPSAWSAWGKCSKNCGGGIKKRTRSMLQEAQGAGTCLEKLIDELECNENPCPQDCDVSNWGNWNGCNKTCGHGRDTRSRQVTKEPKYGGKQCPGLEDTKSCNTHHCPQNCIFSAFGSFTQCTKSCGGGKMTARRTILTAQGYGGEGCPASPSGDADPKTWTRSCESQDCPIDCKTSTWKYTKCTKSCAEVIQDYVEVKGVQLSSSAWRTRTRTVLDGGKALYGGKGCPHLFEKTVCNSYAECMAQFFSTQTPAPTPYSDAKWHENIATATHQKGSAEASNEALKTVRATNPPTAFPTPAPIIVPDTCQNCASAGQCETVDHGWHGAGAGSNWCNLCRCNDGMMQCQKRKCGTDGLLQGETCSHTTCKVNEAYTSGAGDNVVSHKVIEVSHHHSEKFGSLHHCSYMLNTQSCACHCFGNTFKSIIAAQASVEAALK